MLINKGTAEILMMV